MSVLSATREAVLGAVSLIVTMSACLLGACRDVLRAHRARRVS